MSDRVRALRARSARKEQALQQCEGLRVITEHDAYYAVTPRVYVRFGQFSLVARACGA